MNKDKVQMGITSILLAGTVVLTTRNVGLQQDVNELENKVATLDKIEGDRHKLKMAMVNTDEFSRKQFEKEEKILEESKKEWEKYERQNTK